jgi:hypothetical protein
MASGSTNTTLTLRADEFSKLDGGRGGADESPKTINLGNLLPLHQPLRLAEELAMIDFLSGERLISGFARDISREYQVHHVPLAESRERFEAAFEIVTRAWSEACDNVEVVARPDFSALCQLASEHHSGCPLAMGTLFEIYHASQNSKALVDNAWLVTLSFDPERDTPEALASYAHAAIADPDAKRKVPWSFLTTRSKANLKPILEHFGQPVAPRHGSDLLNHLLLLYLIDR